MSMCMTEIVRNRDLILIMKKCRRCQNDVPLDRFVQGKCLDGKGSWCLPCFSAYQMEKFKAKQQLLDKAKSSPCVSCGGVFPPCCMDFDHVVGVKFGDVSRLRSHKDTTILAEIEKCAVICACCHRVRSSEKWPTSKRARHEIFKLKVNILKDAPCMDCGLNFPSVAMDFDHVRGVKFHMVSTMVNYSWDRVLSEVAKCDLVCACCHRLRTHDRIAARSKDGSYAHVHD